MSQPDEAAWPVELNRWLGASGLSSLGDSITMFVLAWVAAGHGPGTAGLVATVEAVPLFLLIVPGGMIADRVGLRTVMVAGDAARLALMIGLAVVAGRGPVPIPALVLVAAAAGTFSALQRPARSALPRLYCSGDGLARVLATGSVLNRVAGSAGPFVGGILLGLGGVALTSVFDAATFVVALAALLTLAPAPPPTPIPAPTEAPAARSSRQGLRRAVADPMVVSTVIVVALLAAAVLPGVSFMVPLLGAERGWRAEQTGLVVGAWVAGGLPILAVVARRGAPTASLSLIGALISAGGVLGLTMVDGLPAVGAAVGLVGLGSTLVTARVAPRLLDAAPAGALGSYAALLGLAQTAPVLVVSPMLAWVAATVGLRAALGVSFLLAAAVVPAVWRIEGSRVRPSTRAMTTMTR